MSQILDRGSIDDRLLLSMSDLIAEEERQDLRHRRLERRVRRNVWGGDATQSGGRCLP